LFFSPINNILLKCINAKCHNYFAI
jgi:hypothetical protein